MCPTATLDAPPTGTLVRNLARGALAGIALFALLVLAQSALRHDRSPVRDFVSEYAVGDQGWVQNLAFLGLGLGELALGIALWLNARGRGGLRLVAVIVGVGGLAAWASAAFEADLDEAPSTLHGQVHDLVGLVAFLSLFAAMIVRWRVGRPTPNLRRAAAMSGIAALLMLVGFPLVGAGESHGWGGLAQRYMIAVFLGWLAILALEVSRHPTTAGHHP